MPAMRRVARRTARRTASRQADAVAPEQAAAASPVTDAAAVPEEPAYMAELEQLNELKEKGILSDEEYEAKKKQILGI